MRLTLRTICVSIALYAVHCANGPLHSSPNVDASVERMTQNPIGERPGIQTCKIPPPPALGSLKLTPKFPGLTVDRPLWFGARPNDHEVRYVASQSGQIIGFTASPPLQQWTFLSLNVLQNHNEEGLLGLAFHPRYETDGRIFVYHSAGEPRRAVVAEYRRAMGNSKQIDPDSRRVILEIPQPYGNHNGGDLRFGPDGYLYIAVGDGGSVADPHQNGQDRNSLLGAILRIDIDHADPACATPYTIPSDNPFAAQRCQPGVESMGAPEVWAWGFRNVWRMSFDRATGELWAGDVGQDAWEEVNIVEMGKNYGWNQMEGAECFTASCQPNLFEPPVYAYDRDAGQSITGGFVYRGNQFPALWGQYIFGDFESGRVWALDRANDMVTVTLLARVNERITSFGEDDAGELYVVTFEKGIMVFEETVEVHGTQPIPDTLEATGCFSRVDRHEMAPGVVAYSVNSPLWADGLQKERFIAFPAGKLSTVLSDGRLDLPIGTVILKTFTKTSTDAGPIHIETRIIRRGPSRWSGYTYQWRNDQLGADLVQGKTEVDMGEPGHPQYWTLPSRAECDRCHVQRLGYALGLSIQQLDRPHFYGDDERNQVDAWVAGGLLANAPATDMRNPLASPTDQGEPLGRRVRALLDTNCAMCHQPDGPADAEMDLRHSVAFEEMGLCNAEPVRGSVDVPGGLLLIPGDPGHSLLLRRMQIRTEGQMPPLGTHLTDPTGTDLINRWIHGMSSCLKEVEP
jgi:uncharacterized repeat protein (TIGR03806 family)